MFHHESHHQNNATLISPLCMSTKIVFPLTCSAIKICPQASSEFHLTRTTALAQYLKKSNISIHAPARGATDMRSGKLDHHINFNPRSREGSDKYPFPTSRTNYDFNPRSREGSDRSSSGRSAFVPVFQSTLPRRERRSKPCCTKSASRISIHAPAKGATLYSSFTSLSTKISIHAPAKGATTPLECLHPFHQISIHAPAKGATRINNLCHFSWIISIHAPAKGATDQATLDRFAIIISIHAPAKGATAILPKSYTLLLSKITNFIFTLHHLFITET